MTNNSGVAIWLRKVTKIYTLYKNDNARLLGLLGLPVRSEKKRAVDSLSLTIHRGEAVALIGRNGAGKSTILKIITGVSYPTYGKVRVNGRVSALLELGAGFDPELTGRENIRFRAEVLGIEKEEYAALEKAVIEFAELGTYIDQPVRTYSSGMKARLGFAISINIRPDIIIVDEALSVGDQVFRAKCLQTIKKIMEDDVTFLFVTHSLREARTFCKRGIVLRDGKVVFDGKIEEAISFYQDSLKNGGTQNVAVE